MDRKKILWVRQLDETWITRGILRDIFRFVPKCSYLPIFTINALRLFPIVPPSPIFYSILRIVVTAINFNFNKLGTSKLNLKTITIAMATSHNLFLILSIGLSDKTILVLWACSVWVQFCLGFYGYFRKLRKFFKMSCEETYISEAVFKRKE